MIPPKNTHGDVPFNRIVEMLVFSAELVDRLGPIALPILRRMEREYAARKKGSEADRIRAMLAADGETA